MTTECRYTIKRKLTKTNVIKNRANKNHKTNRKNPVK